MTRNKSSMQLTNDINSEAVFDVGIVLKLDGCAFIKKVGTQLEAIKDAGWNLRYR